MSPSKYALHPQSAPVVQLRITFPKGVEPPEGFEEVDEYRDRRPPTERGSLVLQGEALDFQSIMGDLLRQGFVLVRVFVVCRLNTKKMLVAIFVHKTKLTAEDRPALKRVVKNVEKFLDDHFLDARVYRNPGKDGGNFVIETGHPRLATVESSTGDLRVYFDGFKVNGDEVVSKAS
ncbi:MAG: hypothetical protein AAB690_01870 [Patescibacteria group bacterium]